MKASALKNAIAVLMLFSLSFCPVFGDSPLIKGSVQRNVQGQPAQAETKPLDVVPPAETSVAKAQLGAVEEASNAGEMSALRPEQQNLDAQAARADQISKQLREKTFQLQNSQSAAQLGVQQKAPLQAKANGGEEVYGCLGALLNLLNGAILKIFPQSDLNRLEVQPGDRIVGVNGHRYDFRTIVKEMVGTPGTIIELDIQTPERVVKHLEVRRTDARLLPQTGMYKQLTKRNRFW